MIRIDRNLVTPSAKSIATLEKEHVRAQEFFKRKDRGQERFDIRRNWGFLRPDLGKLFNAKCAYCESRVEGTGFINHFRPKSGASDLEGNSMPDWYWWLIYEWENIYLACRDCHLTKLQIFPVHGSRASPEVKGQALRKEKALLIDPCNDEPYWFFDFSPLGIVRPLRQGNFARAEVTIEVLNLNRSELVQSRRKSAAVVGGHLLALENAFKKTQKTSPVKHHLEEILKDISPAAEFAAVKRQMTVKRLLKRTFRNFLFLQAPDELEKLEKILAPEIEVLRKYPAEKEPADSGSRSGKRTYRSTPLGQASMGSARQRSTPRLYPEPGSAAPRPIPGPAPEAGSARQRPMPKPPPEPIATRKIPAFSPVRKGAAPSVIKINYDAVYIRRVEIDNFRAIDQMAIDFNEWAPPDELRDIRAELPPELDPNAGTDNESERVGWKVLLGENGTGKSSFLKALALALNGEKYYKKNRTAFIPNRIFNKKTKQRSGRIYVELSKGEPIEIAFTRHDLKFISGKSGLDRVFLRGYGAARLFSRRSKGDTGKSALKETGNLLYPEKLLKDPDAWLLGLKKKTFDTVGLVLRDLLNLPATIKKPLTRATINKERTTLLDSGFGELPLADHSDGNNSILALVADMMSGLHESLHDMRLATGVVLLDEIDAHLHPKWKMRIVESLRRSFPRIQFIATTHEPLCLRGLGEGEIIVMKKIGAKVSVITDLPSPRTLRIDQLLTSDLFGLDSTVDPTLDYLFQEYYQLLAQTTLTDAQAKRLALLKPVINQHTVLGDTKRDQLVYEAIDAYIAKERVLFDEGIDPETREKTKNAVLDIWNSVST